jgi:hypothetical protein
VVAVDDDARRLVAPLTLDHELTKALGHRSAPTVAASPFRDRGK